jgi:hypothetical protein
MPKQAPTLMAKAIYPLDDSHLVILLDEPVASVSSRKTNINSGAGLTARSIQVNSDNPTRVVVTTKSMCTDGVVVDSLQIQDALVLRVSGKLVQITTPKFIHGVKDPTELKALQLEGVFPFASRLIGVHVSVSCCTGCNGGVHDRNLVVLNHHVGGPWTGIWVQTAKTIEAPYPRWQKVLCAGGVISDYKGSVTVVDEGWMEIHKNFEVPHHAPPPLPVTCAQISNSRSKTLLSKGLDASWVEFSNIVVESAEVSSPPQRVAKIKRLTRNQIIFTDSSGAKSTAFLYQPTGLKVSSGAQLKKLRGFVHAEAVGQYVVLSDKEEDIVL